MNLYVDASNPDCPNIITHKDADEGKTTITILVGIGALYNEEMCDGCPHLSDLTPEGAMRQEYACQYYQEILDADMAGPYRCEGCLAGSIKKYEIICPSSGGIEFHG